MEPPRGAARLRPAGAAPPQLLTAVVAAGFALVIIVVTSVLAAATSAAAWSWWLLIWAIPAGGVAGIGHVALLRWHLADAVEQLRRFTELAERAQHLSHRLTAASSQRRSQHRARPGAASSPEADATQQATRGRRRASPPAGTKPAGTKPAGTKDAAPRDPGRTFVTVINQLVSALDAERSYRSIVDATGDVVLLVDSLGQIAIASDSVEQVLGLTPATMTNQPLARYVHASDLEELLDLLENVDADGRADRRSQRPRLRLRAADHSWRVLEWVISQWPAERNGDSTLLTGRDVTEQVALQEELVHQAQHDALTGLPNRVALIARLSQLVAQASPGRPIAVLMIDLDHFKAINDSRGHAAGDALLTQVGARLRAVLRPGDVLARIGGDEFAVVVQTGGLDGAELVAGRLASQLEDPFPVDGEQLTVTASIGISLSHGEPAQHTERPEPADAATLLSEAEVAMYRAKETGSSVAVFLPASGHATSGRLELADELRAAIASGQLVLHYQPIIDIRSTQVAGLEALVRWQHPQRGLLQPSDFLPIAEESGLIPRLSQAVLDQALSQLAIWIGQGWPLQVAVNVSPAWLRLEVASEVAAALERHGVPARLLRLEITEAAAIANPEQSLPRLHRLRELGVRLSLDDFGTGFSSMTQLRTLPIDQVKVDRTFVATMVRSEQDVVTVRAAIELGRKLGLSVVAEGIEDPDSLARVIGAGCSLAQGFYFAQPMPADQVLEWIQPRFPASVSNVAS